MINASSGASTETKTFTVINEVFSKICKHHKLFGWNFFNLSNSFFDRVLIVLTPSLSSASIK